MTGRCRRGRGRISTAAALVCIVAVASCSLATDATPRDIGVDQLPPALQPGEAETTTTTPAVDGDMQTLTIYLVTLDDANNQLLRALNRLTVDTTPRTMLTELKRLTPDNIANGLGTLINDEYRVVGTPTTDGETLVLPLSDEFYALSGNNRSLAAAQLVFTATATAAYSSVLFVDEDLVTQAIPTSDLSLPDPPRAMTRRDFTRFDPLTD